ncbi:unnamed protein product [Pieris macdunnoughi]|uniref:Uncharacterized protein n=1 Tax=Pieris macdunnoughi TaxID=345717 RepID=A0A821RKC3_9NEOP|nr:unnamed protein product [Pieris macdunnoughi]
MTTPTNLYIYKNSLQEKDNAFMIRIPNFWKDNVVTWFSNFEALTSNSVRTDDELAEDVISQLDLVDKALVSDITEYPPLNGFYDALKKRLVSLYKDSDSKSRALLVVWSSESFKLSRIAVFDDLLKSDETLKSYMDLISIAEIFTKSLSSIVQATKELTSLSVSQTSDHVQNDHNLNKKSKAKKTKKVPLPLCYYHETFGSEARNCASPCGFYD